MISFISGGCAGLVESDFHNDNGASDYLRQLKEEVRKQKSDDDLR